MNPSKLAEDLEKKTNLVTKNFNCSICMDFFQNPVITNCQHVFCRKCIEEYIGDKRYKDCPLCKNQINTRSLKNFEVLNTLVSKAKDLSEAFNSDKANLKAKGILKETTPATNKNNMSMLKRKRSSCNDETDSFKRSRTSDTRLSNKTNTNEEASTKARVEKWLNTIEVSPREIDKENEAKLDGNNTKACCSKITITRLAKVTKDLNNNREDERTVQINLNNDDDNTSRVDQTKPTTSHNLNTRDAPLNEYYNISSIDMVAKIKLRFPKIVHFQKEFQLKKFNPIKFRKEDHESTHNATSKSKLTTTVTVNARETIRVIHETPNQTELFHNNDNERPISPRKEPVSRVKFIQFIQKGSLVSKLESSHETVNLELTKKNSTNMKNSHQRSVQTDDLDEYILIECILLNEVFNQLKDEALNEYLKSYSNEQQKQSLISSNSEDQTDDSKTSTSSSESKSKKKPLFRRSSSKFQTLEFVKNNNEIDKQTINETVIESSDSTSSSARSTSRLVVEDTPTKNDESNEKLNEINRTLSKSANRMELVDSRIYLKNLSLETSAIDDVDADETKQQQEETNLEKTLILEDKEEEEEEEVKKVSQSKKNSIERVQNYSNVMNSMNVNDMTYMNMTNNNSKEMLKFPPPANDILGASYMRDSMSIMVTEDKPSSAPKVNDSLENKSVATTSVANSLKDKETQLLTESQLNVIDTISKQNNSYFEKKVQNESFAVQKGKEAQRVEFVCSLLKNDMKELLKSFSNHINAKIENDVTDTTTHLVVDSDEKLICGVTSKYLKAISRKIWIVSILWIKACVKQKNLIDPSGFEIQGDSIFGVHYGPRMSRLSRTKLFMSHEFLFLGSFNTEKIPLEEILVLVELNGGRVVKKARDFTSSSVRIVVFDQSKEVDKKVTNKMWREASLYSLTMSWLLDSLACYKLFEFETYALYDT